MMDNIWILAQADGNNAPSGVGSERVTSGGETMTKTDASDPNTSGGRARSKGPLGDYTFLIMIFMFVMLYIVMFRGPRKKQQEHRKMVQTLSKNDRVRTIGGIIGTVVDIKDDEITLKVDESNNTKIKVAASAIGRNTSKDNS